MKIVVITGSHHKNGTSAHLAAAFIRGAEETGHEVCRFDAAFRQVHPCIACETCHNTNRGCVFADDMKTLYPELLAADAVVFATPIYYYAMNAQIRAVIDRFYACDAQLHHNKKTALLVTMADNTMESAAGFFSGHGKVLGLGHCWHGDWCRLYGCSGTGTNRLRRAGLSARKTDIKTNRK